MSLAEDSLTRDVRQHFKVEIERKIFDAAVLGFDSENNPLRILFEGDGSVDVRLQYGSDADLARDDGAVSYDSYPLDCKFEADTERPLEISIVPRSLRIDTDSFYDNVED